MKGWLQTNCTGSRGRDDLNVNRAVAAAASVPSSSTVILALWIASLNEMVLLPVNDEKSADGLKMLIPKDSRA